MQIWIKRAVQQGSVALGFVLSGFFSTSAFSALVPPDCLDHDGVALQINNAEVLDWKKSTRSGFLERARIQGKVSKVFGVKGDHWHFEVQLSDQRDSVIEIIYNRAFGDIDDVQLGMEVQGCGDYITSSQRNGPYPPSPSGAILHWVHANSRGGGHKDGYLVVNDKLYGFEGDALRNGGGRGNGGRRR